VKSPLNFLGTGACFNISKGNTSAFFKPNEKTIALIDCGENIYEKIFKNNLLTNIENLVVFVTHMHSDHVGSLPSLLFAASFMSNIKNVSVVCECIDEMKLFLKICGNPKANLISCNEFSGTYGIKCSSVPAKHGKMKASSYFFETNGNKFYYSGDTSEINLEAVKLLKEHKLDCIFHEATSIGYGIHTEISKLEKVFEPAIRNKVFCIHISNDNDEKLFISKGFNVPCHFFTKNINLSQ